MYWTDWGEEPRIERAGMDSSNRYCNYKILNQLLYFFQSTLFLVCHVETLAKHRLQLYDGFVILCL